MSGSLFLWLAFILMLGAFCMLAYTAARANVRLGWDAYHDGLKYNPTWGGDICRGWRRACEGKPRP